MDPPPSKGIIRIIVGSSQIPIIPLLGVGGPPNLYPKPQDLKPSPMVRGTLTDPRHRCEGIVKVPLKTYEEVVQETQALFPMRKSSEQMFRLQVIWDEDFGALALNP